MQNAHNPREIGFYVTLPATVCHTSLDITHRAAEKEVLVRVAGSDHPEVIGQFARLHSLCYDSTTLDM